VPPDVRGDAEAGNVIDRLPPADDLLDLRHAQGCRVSAQSFICRHRVMTWVAQTTDPNEVTLDPLGKCAKGTPGSRRIHERDPSAHQLRGDVIGAGDIAKLYDGARFGGPRKTDRGQPLRPPRGAAGRVHDEDRFTLI
jgi:hypothetical protein